MEKSKAFIIFLVFALLVETIFVVAQITNNRDVTLSKTEKITLTTIGLTDYVYNDYSKDGLYQRCLYKEDVIDTCSGWIKQSELDKWELNRLKDIVNATITRQDNIKIKIQTGDVTIR